MPGALFLPYAQACIGPTRYSSDIVIADTIRRHNVVGCKKAGEAVGAPYAIIRRMPSQ